MPLFLVHGFKWPRYDILVHVLNNGLEKATADWTMTFRTSDALLAHFCMTWPDIMDELPKLRFFEHYEPSASREESMDDFAFVVDRVQECPPTLGFTTLASIAAQTQSDGDVALGKLRDNLAKEADIDWWVVYNAGEKRDYVEGGYADDKSEEEQTIEESKAKQTRKGDVDNATQTSGGLLERDDWAFKGWESSKAVNQELGLDGWEVSEAEKPAQEQANYELGLSKTDTYQNNEKPTINEEKPSKAAKQDSEESATNERKSSKTAKQDKEAENKVLSPSSPFVLHPNTNTSSSLSAA